MSDFAALRRRLGRPLTLSDKIGACETSAEMAALIAAVVAEVVALMMNDE